MNRVYKVIYNRARNLYQVVSEITHSRGKARTVTARQRHERLTTSILIALLAMGTSLPVGWAADTASTTVTKDDTNAVSGGAVYTEVRPTADANYVKSDHSTAQNLTDLDKQVTQNADDIAKKADATALDAKADKTDLDAKANTSMDNLTDAGKQAIQALLDIQGSDNVTVSNATNDTNKTKTFTITVKTDGTVASGKTGLVTSGTVYSEVRPSADGTYAYVKTTNTTAQNLTDLDTQVYTNANDISSLKNLSNISTDGKTAIKNLLSVVGGNDQVTVTHSDDTTSGTRTYKVTVKKDGAITADSDNLVTGKTVYEYLSTNIGTLAQNGNYIKQADSVSANLSTLDTQIKNVIDAVGLDPDNTKTSYTSKLNKYFKVNPKVTTTNTTTTYEPDAAANGINSVAIGPNAKTATYTTTVTSGDSTTTTETAADHAVAIGDGATVNAAGDQGVALGNGAVTGEAETSTSDGTTTTTTDAKGGESSVAIGDTAKASGNQALAFGKGASVLNPSGTAVSTGSTAIGSGAKVDGGDNSIALGTSATVNKVSDAMALGNGATINKTATGSIALGESAVTGGTDKPITLTNGTTGTLAAAGGVDSIAIGNGAVSEGNEALALGKGAKVTNGATGGDSAAAIVKTGSAAIGDGANVYNSATSMAIGNGASISEGENTTVIGSGARASQTKQAFVAGYQASSDSSAKSSVAIGDNASTHSARTTAIGYKAEAYNADSIAIGSEAKTDDNGGGIAIGNKASVAQGGIAIGSGSTQASNTDALAIGNGAVADVNQSISIGYNAGVGTTEDYKERNGSLVAIGTSAGNNVKGMQNVAIGASAGSSVLSSNNIAIGTNAGYGIKNVTSDTDTNPQNGYNISIGAGANYTEGNTNQNIVSSIAIGHGTHAVNRAVAIGEGASAQGDSGMALGNNASSSGSGSIAIGNTASASNGNIALGAGAIATDKPTGTGKWTNSVAPSYYISVGGKGNGSDSTITLRRISNVADGSADQDVVTVKQLQKVSDDLENTIKGIDTSQLKTYSTTEIDNKIAEVNQNIKDSGVKYFSINAASQSTNSNNTGANGDGDADAMAIGPNAKASSIKALAIGNNVSASGTLSIAIGTASNPSTSTTTAETPHPTSSEGTSSVAIGTSAIAQTDDSIAIGTRAATYTANTTSTPVSTVGVQSIAIGFSAETRDDNAISIGTKSKANSVDAIAIGDGAEALNTSTVVIGKASIANGSESVTIGESNTNDGKGVMTTGNSNKVTNNQESRDVVKDSGIYGSSNTIQSVSSSNSSNAITDVYAVGNSNTLNQNGEKNVLNDVSIMGNKNTIENGTAGAYTQTVKQIAVVGSGNTVKGNTDINTTTWGTVQRDTILGYGNTVDATKQSTPVSNLQILGNDVTATLGNSVYLGTGSSATASKSATAEAIQLAKDKGDTEALASDEYKNAATDEAKNAIKQKYEAKYIHAANIAAMDKDGVSAGVTNYDTDYTYGNDSTYTYAGSQADGVVTVGSKDATRRIQNVSAGLVGPNSTDAVNGSQLYALTRQLRFGGDNSSFGKTTAAEDQNVVARGSNETISITGGSDAVKFSTADGTTTYTVDAAKLTGNNIAVVADKDANALHVQLASNLKDLNTAQLGSGNGDSYKETIKLDGTGLNGGQMTLADANGTVKTTLDATGLTITGGPKFTSSSIDAANQQIHNVTAGKDDADAVNVKQLNSARTLLTQGKNTTLSNTEADGHHTYTVNVDNLAVKANGTGTTTVELAKGINFKDGTNTTATVGDNGTIKFNVSDAAIKKQAVEAVNVTGGSNVTVTPETNADGTLKTFTVTATHNKLNAAGSATKATADSNAVTLTLQDADGNTTTTGLTDTYTTVSKDGTNKKVTFKRNDGETQTLELSDLGGITAAQDKYITGGTVSYDTKGDGTAALTGTNGITASITGLKDTKVSSGTATYVGTQGDASGSATLTMNDGSTATLSGLKDDYITSAAVGTENNHVTMTRLGGGTVDLNLNPILEKYSLSDYHLVGAGTTHDQAYAVDSNGTVTLNVVDDKNPTGTPKTIQITGLASQSGVSAGRTTVTSSDHSVTVNDSSPNSDTHTYDIKVDYSKIPANLKVQYRGDNGTAGSNTMNTATAFTGTANQIVTTAADGKVSFKLVDNISGIQSVSTGDAKLDTNGLTVTNGPTFTKSNIDVNNQQIHKVTAGTLDTDVANVGQVKAATTEVRAGTNASLVATTADATDKHNIYTVNVDNLSLSQNGTKKVGTGVALKDGLDFQNGTNTTASVTADGKVSFSISNDAIKAQAKDAVVLSAGDNVTIGTPTDANNVKTYTVSVNDLKLQADGANKATRKLADGINFAGGTNTTADVTADGKVTYDLKDSISLNQVQTGESTLNTNGLTITDGPKVLKSGIDAGNKQITNVASGGTVESNAATIGDLKKAIETASAGTTASGFKTKGNYGEAVTSRLDKQLNIVGDVDTTKVAKDNLSNDNVGVVTSTDTNGNATLTVKLNKDINLGENGSVTTGSTVMNKAGITNGNMSLGADGLTIQNGPKFTNNGINAANQKVTGVANGTDPNDAVNVSQLEAVKSDVTAGWTIAGKNASGTDLTANIGKGKTVSYAGGKYATATLSVDSTTGNATVAVDAVTNTLSVGADGKITSNGDGLTTTGAVKDAINGAINGAYWTIQAGNATGNAEKVSAGSTITFNAGSNLSLSQDGTNFTYALNTDLQDMTSVTTKDQKDNTAVLTGEGLKVSDKDGNSLTQHATEIRLHDATKSATDTTTDVVLNKQGLQNGGHTITGVANGTVDAGSQDAINGSQLYELQQKVTNGWKITGDDTTKASNIGNDKTVSFVNGDNSYIKAKVDTTNTGATVSYTAQTASLTTTDGKAALTGTTDGLVTGTNLTSVLNSLSWTAQSSQVGSGQNNGSTLQSITAGSKVGFIAGNNMILTQDGTNFTYALNSSLTGMNTIAFTGLGSGASNLTIGLQNGGGANPDKGYYITGLSNTKWDQSNYEGTRAATEAQLREAIDTVSAATGTGGFGLTADDGANNGGETKVTQTLGRTIAIQGDGTYGADGKVVKQGNISTVAYTDNAGPTGAIKVKLNKDIDLSETGSLTIGASKVSAGSIVLDNTGDAAKKIALNSTAGTASIGSVTVNGAAKTVMGLANTTWDGTAVSGRAATEDQLAKAISDASTQASNSELHIRKGTYGVGKDKDGQYLADPKGKNSVSIDVVNAKGAVDGQVVINDVAKASELGTVGELADTLKNPAGGSTTVVQAVNKVNQKVDDSLKQVNGDVTNAVTEAKKHTEVQSVDSDNNVTIDGTATNAAGGKVYKLGLNKQHMNLDKVHIYGTEGKVTAKDVEAETVKTGNTTVADGRVVVGGDNGIKIEANGDQQTISGLSNKTWNGRVVSGRAATEDQLQQAVENATATAAQNEQHIQAGNYNVGQGKGLDGKAIDKNSVAINVVSGDGTKPGDVKGQVVINNVAKADELGDVAKLNDTVKNADGRPTSTVDAINNLDKRVETTVGDNVYSGVKGKEIADGDSATTAIGKLNNRMNDIYTTAGQHSSVSTADTNLTLSESKNASGGTDYKIGLNKDQIDLGNLTIKGNEGSIETKFIKSDSFTAGDTVVNKDGIKVGDKSALTGDSLKVNGKTYVDDKGVDANGQVIRNVGDGKDDGDAVNVKQVNDLAARQGEVIGQNAAHINQLDRAVNRLDSRINRVGAGAAALAALHPGNYDPDDKVDFAAGFGNYRGASAAAVGMYYHPDETTTMSVGASFGGGENMVNAGITWKMGKDSGHMRTQAATKAVPVQFVAAPTQTMQPTGQTEGTKTPQPVTAVTTTASGQQVPIVAAYLPSVDNSTRAENDELKELLARQTAILEKLAEQKTSAAPAAAAVPISGEDLFPDVPENHWAYDFVAKLAKAGALKDCRVEDPANNPMLTRNDFAQILYTALKNGATKNPALNKDNGLNRLASEFRTELKNVKR